MIGLTSLLRRACRALRRRRFAVWITPELALGPAFTSGDIPSLAREGVGAVVEVRSAPYDDEEALARRGILLRRVLVKDRHAPTQRQLQSAAQWALEQIAVGRKVYVHCRSGLGRSPCVATAILIAMGYPLADAYAEVRARRPWLNLSESQWKALERFEKRMAARPAGLRSR